MLSLQHVPQPSADRAADDGHVLLADHGDVLLAGGLVNDGDGGGGLVSDVGDALLGVDGSGLLNIVKELVKVGWLVAICLFVHRYFSSLSLLLSPTTTSTIPTTITTASI